MALRYAVMLSGVTKLIITKTDVLDSFSPLKVATGYIIDGAATKEFPFDVCGLEIEPVYETFAGWSKPISTCKDASDLPKEFTEYCAFVENYLETKIAYVSNGTGRDQLLVFS